MNIFASRLLRRVLLALSLLVIVGFSAAWWWIARISEQQLAARVVAAPAGQGLRAESVRISGFPNRFVATFEKPVVGLPGSKIYSDEPLKLVRNVIGSHYTLILPNTIRADANGQILTCRYPEAPRIELKIAPLALERHQIELGGPEKVANILKDPNFYKAFREFHYADKGAVCENAAQNEKISQGTGKIEIVNEQRENRGILYVRASVKDIAWVVEGKSSTPYSTEIDFKIDGYDPLLTKEFPENTELQINTLKFENARYAARVKGNVRLNKTDIFPYGDLRLSLDRYKQMVDELYASAKEIEDRKKLPSGLPEKQKLLEFLAALSAATPEMENIEILARRERGDDLYVGPYKLGQFVAAYQALFAHGDDSRAQ